MPLRMRPLGGPPSTPHFWIVPSSAFTSIQIQACGLTSSTFAIVPLSTSGLSSLNTLVHEWWALMVAALAVSRTPINKGIVRARIFDTPPVEFVYISATMLQLLSKLCGATLVLTLLAFPAYGQISTAQL